MENETTSPFHRESNSIGVADRDPNAFVEEDHPIFENHNVTSERQRLEYPDLSRFVTHNNEWGLREEKGELEGGEEHMPTDVGLNFGDLGSLGVSASREIDTSSMDTSSPPTLFPEPPAGSVGSKRRKIILLIDQCEKSRFPFQKKLILANMNLTCSEVPVDDICSDTLAPGLHKLSLAGNLLITVPDKIVVSLSALKSLDLSQCHLRLLPQKWNLPSLKRLNLSHNSLDEFPDENMFEGLPQLQHLDMYGNKVWEIVVPRNGILLSKLDYLNLGYNNLSYLPEDLNQITSLRTLKVMNNVLEKIPAQVCDMDLRVLDVSSNPLIQPPIETCERGIASMRRYYHCLRREEERFYMASSKKPREKKKYRPSRLFGQWKKATSPNTDDEEAVPKLGEGVAVALSMSGSSLSDATSTFHAATSATSSIGDEVMSTKGHPGPDAGEISFTKSGLAVNDTLKVVFVGNALAGKTTIIKRLLEGQNAEIPKREDRTIGVDIYDWDPRICGSEYGWNIDSRVECVGLETEDVVDVKCNLWDFAGQHVYHATHELFFSRQTLYVLVWNMGAFDRETQWRKKSSGSTYDSSDSEDDCDFISNEEARRADRALERHVDESMQFWIDYIQSSAPGAAILPVATFDDYFGSSNGFSATEAARRCNVMKERLLKHEKKRLSGLKERLDDFEKNKLANSEAALRVRTLLSPFSRPKLLFGLDKECVVMVSGSAFTGFDRLSERIVCIATGRERCGRDWPIFRGHVGVRIPRLTLHVRDFIQNLRDRKRKRFTVVEWRFLVSMLRENGIEGAGGICDALHFLTSIGDICFFGEVADFVENSLSVSEDHRRETGKDDGCKLTKVANELGPAEDHQPAILSQFVVLDPRWLVAAVGCVLRHDLGREIREIRRAVSGECVFFSKNDTLRGRSFHEAILKCPVITATDAYLLWQAKKFVKKAAGRAKGYSNDTEMTMFQFLHRLLVRFGVLVPIDLSIEKAAFVGEEHGPSVPHNLCPTFTATETDITRALEKDSPSFFFLPCLLGPGEPSEAWTYKVTNCQKTTISHSFLFPDAVPPGLMERVTAAVLSEVYLETRGSSERRPDDCIEAAVSQNSSSDACRRDLGACGKERLSVKEILCWRTAFFLKFGLQNNGDTCVAELFVHLVGQESHLCVASNSMGAAMRRLVVSGKGQAADGGNNIWKGGYSLVLEAVERVVRGYLGLEFEKEGVCPECLAKKDVSEAGMWPWTMVVAATDDNDGTIRCQHGHSVDVRFIAGVGEQLSGATSTSDLQTPDQSALRDTDPINPIPVTCETLPKQKPDPIEVGRKAMDGFFNSFVSGPASVPLRYLEDCTNNFSDERLLGKGGFGQVYEGVDRILGRRFAVKRVKAELLSSTEAEHAAKTLERELVTLSHFRHPNIARLYAYSVSDTSGYQCLVFELAWNGSLKDYMRQKARREKLHWTTRIKIAFGTAKAIHYLHKGTGGHSCVHRDVNPTNVCLRRNLEPLLIDFGTTKMISEDDSNVTALDNGVLGTPGYICPTYARTMRNFSKSCDVFSLGVVCVELITGTLQGRADGVEVDHFSQYSKDGAEKNDLSKNADECAGDWDESAKCDFAELATECIALNPGSRPDMEEIVQRLGNLVSRTKPRTPAEKNHITVLVSNPLVWADKEGNHHPIDALNFRRERDILARCISESKKSISISFDVATVERLQAATARRCGCLHFSGHGHPSYLLFEDGQGGAHWVGTDQLHNLVNNEPFDFVFVSACNSGFMGSALVNAGVPHVLCCEQGEELRDDTTLQFTQTFYRSVFEGYTIQAAFDRSKLSVSTMFGHAEVGKFVLLPEGMDHEQPLFEAATMERNDIGEDTSLSIPAHPLHFLGREIETYALIGDILSHRLVTLHGVEGVGCSSLASAVSNYIYDRRTTVLEIEHVYFVDERSPMSALYGYLVAEGKVQQLEGGAKPYGNIVEALLEAKVLIVFDGADTKDPMFVGFLKTLLEKTKATRVLLAAQAPMGFVSSAVIEKSFHLKPLGVESAANLFSKICSRIDTMDRKTEIQNSLLALIWSVENKEEVSEAIRLTLRAVDGGIPARIVEAAQNVSERDCVELIALGVADSVESGS